MGATLPIVVNYRNAWSNPAPDVYTLVGVVSDGPAKTPGRRVEFLIHEDDLIRIGLRAAHAQTVRNENKETA